MLHLSFYRGHMVYKGHTYDITLLDEFICTAYNRIACFFLVTLNDGSQKVCEAKGVPTETWRLKRELFLALYPDIPYEVVTANRTYRAKPKWRRSA
jgi:hypothetical protein